MKIKMSLEKSIHYLLGVNSYCPVFQADLVVSDHNFHWIVSTELKSRAVNVLDHESLIFICNEIWKHKNSNIYFSGGKEPFGFAFSPGDLSVISLAENIAKEHTPREIEIIKDFIELVKTTKLQSNHEKIQILNKFQSTTCFWVET